MRTLASRLLLVGLLVVAIVAVVRLASGPSGTLVSLDGLDADDLAHDSFELGATGTLAIDAAGSYEEAGTPASDTTMAATGWIVRRDDGAVVWRLHPPRPSRGTLVSAVDTVRLAAGTYDVYFASYGDPLVRDPGPRDGSLAERVRAFLSRGGRSWVGEAARWHLHVRPADEAAARLAESPASPRDPARADPAPDSLRIWQARGVRNRSRPEVLISVTAPARVTVRAVTEIADGVVADVPSIVRLGRRDTVWTASAEGTTWAGGSLKNRAVEAEVALEPGIYRVAFDADRSHGYGAWAANPPWRPWEWGLTLGRATPDAAVTVLDPMALDLPVITAFECVGPDADRQSEFTVSDATDVLVVAVGEIESGSRYDWAEIDRRSGDGWDGVWEMDRGTTPAGGDDKNRRAVQALTLEPGTYRLRYRTDGSHDCVGGYNSDGGPDAPLWGAVLYALDPDAGPAAFDVRDVSPDPGGSGATPPTLDYPTSGLLAAVDSVGDGQDRRATFAVAEDAELLVVAAGEISEAERYDYATIERDGGPEVWSMTWENTVPAGDQLLHRRFRGRLALPPGRYVLRYRTDGGGSYGNFGPDSRVLWGARVYDLGASPPSVPPPPPAAQAEVLEVAETQPQLVGGPQALQSRIEYPPSARRDGVQGLVVVGLVVDPDGQPSDLEVLRSPDDRLSEAAIAAVRASRFTPGLQDGRPVRVRHSVSVPFRLP